MTGDTLVRLGLDERTEVQLGFTALGHVRTRNFPTSSVSEDAGIGDLSLALRRNLLSPDGSGTSAAVQAHVSLPTGGSAIGESDWSAALLLPVGFSLGEKLSLSFTPQASLEPDLDRHGHRVAFGGVAGLGFDLSDRFSASAELAAFRDDDPADPAAEVLAGLSVAWQPSRNLQLDAGGNIGLSADAADLEIYFGLVRRF